MTGSGRRLFTGVIGAVALVLGAAGCGGDEQGGLKGASPGPDAVVGGEIAEIELFYDDIVVAIDGSVTDPTGTELGAEFVIDTDIRSVVELAEPLGTPGEYTVRHVVDAVDGDRVEASYSFTYDPDAPPPQLVFPPEDSGSPWLLWLVALVGVAVVGVLGWRLLASMARVKSASQRSRPS
ncbi:copper resistance CopC family protein [Ilumatobacter sp.]|uniref:copper resistance CopC family protein n=1 Tax=Ilumatobacter sp. TaxID=1967498 RepID=UPI003C359D15